MKPRRVLGLFICSGSVLAQILGSWISQIVLSSYAHPLFLALLGGAPLSVLFVKTLSYRNLLRTGLPLSLLALAANVAFLEALSRTSLASALSIEQSATLFALVLSIVFLKASFLRTQLFSVLLSIMGVVLISLADRNQSSRLVGDVLALVSAIAAASYIVMFKLKVESACDGDALALIGAVGMWNLILLFPWAILLHFADIEPIRAPSEMNAGLIMILLLVVFLFNVGTNVGVALTSPVFMRLAATCSIPLSNVIQIFQTKKFPSVMQIAGYFLVLIAFILFALVPSQQNSDGPLLNASRGSNENRGVVDGDD